MNKLKVLIADDSEKLLTALRLHLQAYGFDVMTCSDSYMALEHTRKYRPDVVVLDIQMPAGNGFSVLERMRKLPGMCEIPVIYITGNQGAECELRAERMGARGLIHKPISFPVLLKMLDRIVSQKHTPTEGSEGTGPLWNIPDPTEIPPAGR